MQLNSIYTFSFESEWPKFWCTATGALKRRCLCQFLTKFSSNLIEFSIRDGNLLAFTGIPDFWWSPGSFLRFVYIWGEIFVSLYIYIITMSCWHCALQPQSCLPFYPDSVCLALVRCTLWKWPMLHAYVHFMEAYKRDCGTWNWLAKFHNAILASHA